MKVYLIGVGLGNPDTLTLAARRAIEESNLLIGAPRLLEGYAGKKCVPAILAGDIAAAAAQEGAGPVAVLLSGDIGFYSGAKKLYPLLEGYEVEALPGISSLAYFCARCRTPWEDVYLVSAHGRAHNAPGEIQCHKRTFVLTGGNYRAEHLCRDLCTWGMEDVPVTVGERLSYPEEAITRGAAGELAERQFDSLAVVLVENPRPVGREHAAPGIPDEAFLRGKTPMTKEEVRTLSVSRLRLRPEDAVWDVGAGTGSVSVECALAVPKGRVFAVERSEEALELLAQNREKFAAWNLRIVPGAAPAVLRDLPAPDRVFVGGSGGELEDILRLALEKNPRCRVVVNAVTLETLAECTRCFALLGLEDVAVTELSAARTREAGRYHLLQGLNPVFLLSGEGRP